MDGKVSGRPAPRISARSAENGPLPGRAVSLVVASGSSRSATAVRPSASTRAATSRNRWAFTAGRPGTAASPAMAVGVGGAGSVSPQMVTGVPCDRVRPPTTSRAWAARVRWETSAQGSASRTEPNRTGRRPG